MITTREMPRKAMAIVGDEVPGVDVEGVAALPHHLLDLLPGLLVDQGRVVDHPRHGHLRYLQPFGYLFLVGHLASLHGRVNPAANTR